jgi:hypothetical protein
MTEPGEYKRTLFDKHGAVAADYIKAVAYGAMVSSLSFGAFALASGGMSWTVVLVSLLAGAATTGAALALSIGVGSTWKRFMVDGTSTPYVEQYSYQQALVMQGKLDEALESFEAVIAEQPDLVSPRVKAAELYAREKREPRRAAELFREAQGIPAITAGEYVYVTNRLVDLFTGPLNQPGKALVELRKLIERYPGTAAALQARSALAELKIQQTDVSSRTK